MGIKSIFVELPLPTSDTIDSNYISELVNALTNNFNTLNQFQEISLSRIDLTNAPTSNIGLKNKEVYLENGYVMINETNKVVLQEMKLKLNFDYVEVS